MLYELKSVVRTFKERRVLDLSHLEIEEGKIYSLIGPNGAGKTTLLALLAFLDRPDGGQFLFKSEQVHYGAAELLELRRRVVLVDQYPILFTAPVWKNVEFGLKIRGVPSRERRRRVEEALDLVGMKGFLKAEAHKLSGGETKRVALARALAVRPEVLLCDEPGANVDKENQEIILDILGAINSTEKTSIIFSTHYLAQGRRLADHTVMLEHGLLTDMVNENIYRSAVVDRGRDGVACQLSGRLMVSLPTGLVPEDTQSFKLHVDPDRVRYCPEQPASDGRTLSGHVLQVNQDRGRVFIGMDVGVKLYFFLSMAEYLEHPPVIGARITVVLPDDCLRCTPA